MLRLNKGALLATILATVYIFGGFDAQCSDINNNNNSDEVVIEMGSAIVVAVVDDSVNENTNAATQGGLFGRFAGYCYNRVVSILNWTSSPEPIGDSRFGSLSPDLLKKIFYYACERGSDPRQLERINKHWHDAFRHNISAKDGVSYATKKSDFFMEHCMMSFVDAQVTLMELVYLNRSAYNVKQKVPFLENGVAALSEIGLILGEDYRDYSVRRLFQELGVTKNKTNFIEAGGVHSGKYVTLVLSLPKALDLLPTEVIKNCRMTDVVLLWRKNDGVSQYAGALGFKYPYCICPLNHLYKLNLHQLLSISKTFTSAGCQFVIPSLIEKDHATLGLNLLYFRPERHK